MENTQHIIDFLRKAVELESIIYTSNQTIQQMNNYINDDIGIEHLYVSEYKDGDRIPPENEFAVFHTLQAGTVQTTFRDEMTKEKHQRLLQLVDPNYQDYRTPFLYPPKKGLAVGLLSDKIIDGVVSTIKDLWILPVGGAIILPFIIGFLLPPNYDYNFFSAIIPSFIGTALFAITISIISSIISHRSLVRKANNQAYVQSCYESEREAYLNAIEMRNRKLADEKLHHDYCNEIIRKATKLRNKAKAELAEHYKNGSLYVKYQNFVAVAQILEYFEAGRCDEFAGPDGAYNLYENELRLNIIIGQMEKILEKLDQIHQTQRLIYSAIKETNDLLYSINSELRDLTTAVNINTAAIDAYGAKISKQMNW